MGVNSQNLKNTVSVWSRDGKTFNIFLLEKKPVYLGCLRRCLRMRIGP